LGILAKIHRIVHVTGPVCARPRPND
jgi:hypothetical protein